MDYSTVQISSQDGEMEMGPQEHQSPARTGSEGASKILFYCPGDINYTCS